MVKLRGDFNGLFGDMLCLSHEDTAPSADSGDPVVLAAGMHVIAIEADSDEHGQPDNLIASGVVEPAPDWLSCRGSRWVLHIDEHGVRHESDLQS